MGSWKDYHPRFLPSRKGYYAALRNLRLVACGWSLIIDNAPNFWIYIDPFAQDIVWRMAVEKSKDMLLDVNCMSTHRREEERLHQSFLHQLSSFAQRVHHLDIQEMNLEELVNTGVHMSRLASLFIENETNSDLPHAPWTMNLASWAPSPRDVTLLNCSFDWPNPGWTNLEFLYTDVGDSSRSFDLTKILGILSASPGLKDLHLIGRQSTCVPVDPEVSVVHLPKLETLQIQLQSTIATFELLNFIVASPTLGFFLGINQKNLSPPQLRTIGGFADRLDMKGKILQISHTSTNVGPFSVWIYDRGGTAGEVVIEALRNLLEGLGKSRLENAGIKGVDIIHPSLFATVHSLCPKVGSLRVGNITSEVLTLLSSGTHDSVSRWLFPYISRLCGIANNRELIRDIFKMVKARAEAYEKGEIGEKIRRLELWIDNDNKTERALVAEARGWENEMRSFKLKDIFYAKKGVRTLLEFVHLEGVSPN